MTNIYYMVEETGERFHYENLDPHEVSARAECQFMIRNGMQYEKSYNSLLPNGSPFVLLHELGINQAMPHEIVYPILTLEARDVRTKEKRYTFSLRDHEQAFRFLQSGTIFYPHESRVGCFRTVELDSTEIDEERNCYVYYGEASSLLVDYEGNEI